METMDEKNSRFEQIQISGDNLLAKVRELIEEGNVQRVILKNEEGTTLLEIPLTAGVAATVLAVAVAPVLAAVGAIAALVSNVTIEVERSEPEDDGTTPSVASTTDV
jgi:hypothetical protein